MNSHTMNRTFSLERILQLSKRYLILRKKMILLGGCIVAGLILLQYVTIIALSPSPAFEKNGTFSTMAVAYTLFTWAGYALTSTMFNEMNSTGSATHFITLPASSIEKLLSAWIVSFLCYTIFGMLALYILGLVIDADFSLYLRVEYIIKFFSYVALQSVFLFGAAYFKANNFLSTIVVMMVVGILTALLISLLNYLGIWAEDWSLTAFLGIDTSDTGSILFKNLILTIVASGFFIWMALNRLKKRQIA